MQRGGRRAPDVHLEFRAVQGPEEPEPHDVVHVEMGEEHVDPGGVGAEVGQALDAGAGVEHDVRPVPEPERHARRVAPIPGGARPGARQ